MTTELDRAYDFTIEGFGSALRLKDAGTEGHSKRVTAFSIAIARAMGLPRDQVAVIARGAFLHDIGKIAIPDGILCKPGPLTADESMVMRQYVHRGYEIVEAIPFLVNAAEIVYAHQERYDGSGYPRGLKGEEILLGARLVAVANSLDEITSDLPYRPARSLRDAYREIGLWSGRQFDPKIVQTLLSMPDNAWSDIGAAIRLQRPASSTG